MLQQDRFHALDALRAFALLLGVFFHAAISFVIPYTEGLNWAITDNSTSYPLVVFVAMSHTFRMPLFFFIAGFFAHLMYHRKGPKAFAGNRMRRIVLPMIVAWCVIVPVLTLIWWWGQDKSGMPRTGVLWPSAADWSRGDIRMSHLWFLYYLTLAYLVIVGARHLLIERIDPAGNLRRRIDGLLQTAVKQRWAPIALSLPLALAAPFAPEWNLSSGMPTPDRSLIPQLIPSVGYGVIFAAGWILQRNLSLLPVLSERIGAHMALAGIAAMVSFAAGAGMLLPAPWGTVFRMLTALGATTFTWCTVLALMGLALQKFSEPSPRTRYVAEASYWIYIAHLPVVCALQVWVAHWNLHWTIKYSIIMVIAFAVLFASYHYLVRFTFVGAALNGKKHVRHSESASAMSAS